MLPCFEKGTKMFSKLFGTAAVFLIFTASTWSQNTKSVRYYEELVGSLAEQVRQLQDDNARLTGSVQALRAQVEELARSNASVGKELSELRSKISADAVKREKQLQMIADRLKAPAPQENPPPKQTQAQTQPQTQTPPPTEKPAFTEYEEYVVQKGATLTAIAKAYGVSIETIKKANNKTTDALRIGEKLKIPRK